MKLINHKNTLFVAVIATLALAVFNTGYARAQSSTTKPDSVKIVTSNRYYQQAYSEMADMLDGKSPLSIKRAVFLAEWAYYDGKLDYDSYCHSIDSAVTYLNKFIKVNQLEQYKTGKNIALIDYFFKPLSGNGYKPFIYDHTDTPAEKDFAQQFVTKLIRTHKGQCRSLPYYYKILAEAIGAEAYITYAPIHSWIRYPDADNFFPEDWVNVELTTHQLTPTFWYIESFEINEKALKGKVYVNPLTDRETVASQLSDLAFAYSLKYGVHDEFTFTCSMKSLEYYPQKYNTLMTAGKSIDIEMARHLQSNGNRKDEYAIHLDTLSRELYDRMLDLGWEKLDKDYFERLDQKNEEARRILEETGGIKL